MLLSKFVSSEFGLLTKRLVWLPLNLLIEYIVKKTQKKCLRKALLSRIETRIMNLTASIRWPKRSWPGKARDETQGGGRVS